MRPVLHLRALGGLQDFQLWSSTLQPLRRSFRDRNAQTHVGGAPVVVISLKLGCGEYSRLRPSWSIPRREWHIAFAWSDLETTCTSNRHVHTARTYESKKLAGEFWRRCVVPYTVVVAYPVVVEHTVVRQNQKPACIKPPKIYRTGINPH